MAVFADEDWRAGLALVVGSTRAAARQFAADAVLVESLARRVPAPVGTGEGAIAWQSFVRELAVARRVQDGGAATEIARAVWLTRWMPCTLERLAAGEITVGRAQAFIDELLTAGSDLASRLDAEMIARVSTLAPGSVRQAVRRQIDRYDADAAAARAARATSRRGIRRSSERDGQAQAVVTGPAVPLTRWFEALTAAARALQRQGDPRGLDALRFDLLVAGFTCPEPLEDGPPTSERAPAGSIPMPRDASDNDTTDDDDDDDEDDLPEALRRTLPPAPAPVSPGDPNVPEEVRLAREEAAGVLADARADAGRILAAAHAAQRAALAVQDAARSEADRLTAQVVRERLARSQETPADRRLTRPVQLLIHVPVTTALGLSNEPGWLEGYGWINAPHCRQLLPIAELRQVCITTRGQVIDLAERIVRPDPTPTGMRDALVSMATEPFDITDAASRRVDQHDPTDSIAEFIHVRDMFCDGPLGTLWPARNSDLDHDKPYNAAYSETDDSAADSGTAGGPTAAWNLTARSRRTHRLKHRGWTPWRTATGTLWFSPAGQIVNVPHHHQPPPGLDEHAQLPDPNEIHELETELLRTPTDQDDPPF